MISRGQIYFTSLDPIQGREQSGRRPALVVSSDAINRQPLVVAAIVGTDAANIQRDYPTNIRVTAAESGLPRDTVFLAFQVRSLDHSRFTGPAVGSLSPVRMAQVADALRLTLDL
jgi:mRNA interferase MazF